MRYFKDSAGKVFGYDEKQVSEGLSKNKKEITGSELDAILKPANSLPEREKVDMLRRAAYANPLTGSDRLFVEASRMRLMEEPGAEDALEKAISRYQEIQVQYPRPS